MQISCIFMIIILSVPAYGFSLDNGVKCTMCGGGGKRDAQGDARQGTGEEETRGIVGFRGVPPRG